MDWIDWIFLPLALIWAGIYAYRKLRAGFRVKSGPACSGCGSADGCTSKPKEINLVEIKDIKPLAKK